MRNKGLTYPLALATFALMVGSTTIAQAAELTDAEILGIYAQVNGFDIETALLGQNQGNSKNVRTLAKHVAEDHSKVRLAASDIAKKCGVVPTLPVSRHEALEAHSKVITSLSEKRGAAFDSAYLAHEVQFHEAAVGAVKNLLLPAATCPQLKQHLTEVLPAFEHHLAETRRIATTK